MARFAWGIDVSKSSAKAVRLEVRGGTIVLTDVDVEEYPIAQGSSEADQDEHIREAIATLKSRNKIKGDAIAVSLPGHAAFNRFIRFFATDESQIERMVRHEADQQIPFDIDEVLFDYHLTEPFAPGDESRAILFAIKKEVVEHFLSTLDGCGIMPSVVQFSPAALYNFLVYDQGVKQGSIALDLGADNTDLVVLDDPRFWIRNLAITGNDITKSISSAHNIPFAEAEKIKKNVSKKDQAIKLFKTMEPTLKDLVGEIQRSMGFYKSISRTAKFERVYLCGNGSKTINFQKFMSTQLRMPAARLSNLNKIEVGANVDENLLTKVLPALGPAIGLGLQALGECAADINLIPEGKKTEQAIQKKLPAAAAAAAILLITVVLMYVKANSTATKLDSMLKSVQGVEERYNEQKARYVEAQGIAPKYESYLQDVTSFSRDRDLALDVINEVGKVVPDNSEAARKLWLVELNEEVVPIPMDEWSDAEFFHHYKKVTDWVDGRTDDNGDPINLPRRNEAMAQLKEIEAAAAGFGGQDQTEPYPTKNLLKVRAVVAVENNNNVLAMKSFVEETITTPVKDAFLKKLGESSVSSDTVQGDIVDRIVHPDVPKGGLGMGPAEKPTRYQLFTIQWTVPFEPVVPEKNSGSDSEDKSGEMGHNPDQENDG